MDSISMHSIPGGREGGSSCWTTHGQLAHAEVQQVRSGTAVCMGFFCIDMAARFSHLVQCLFTSWLACTYMYHLLYHDLLGTQLTLCIHKVQLYSVGQ